MKHKASLQIKQLLKHSCKTTDLVGVKLRFKFWALAIMQNIHIWGHGDNQITYFLVICVYVFCSTHCTCLFVWLMQTILWLNELDCVWLHWVKVRLERRKPLWICSQDLPRCYLLNDQIDAKQPHNYVFVIVHHKSAYRDFNFLTQISLLKIAIRNSEWLKTLCKGNEREIVSSRKVKRGILWFMIENKVQ